MAVTTLLNQKGGVGKTSTCYHLSGTFAQMGRKVLLVDCDPQASLTQGFIGPEGMRALPPEQTVAAIFAGDEPFPGAVIRPVMPGVDLLPGSRLATRYNVPEPQEASPEAQGCLREFLAEVRVRYDHVLLDCPPNLHLCSWAALAAADYIVLPLQPEDFGAQGIAEVRASVSMVRAALNPELILAGILVTRIAVRKSVHQFYEAQLREEYGDDVFATMIPDSVDYLEAILARKPVAAHKPKGAAAKAIRSLADELEKRVAARRAA